MRSDGYYRQLVLRIGERAERGPLEKPPWHESLGTLMLGALSTSLGFAVLASLVTRNPSFDIFVTAYVGQWLGMAGLFLGRRMKRGPAPLSIAGTFLCLIPLAPIYLALILALTAVLLPVAVLVYGVRALLRAWA